MTSRPLESADQTAAEMVRLVTTYAGDIGEKANWTLPKYFRFVANLEYKPDPKGHESVSRPALSMSNDWPWRDCDDKAVMIGAYCWLNCIPFKFVASSKRPDFLLHHVWVKALIGGKELPLDATYPKNFVGFSDPKNTIVKPLTGDIMQSTLNTFEGDETLQGFGRNIRRSFSRNILNTIKAVRATGNTQGDELLGSSFISRMKRRARAGQPGNRRRRQPMPVKAMMEFLRRSRQNTLQGEELLGSSFLSRMKRRAGNLARQTSNIARQVGNAAAEAAPILDQIAPGLGSKIKAAADKVKGQADKFKKSKGKADETAMPVTAEIPIWKKPWFIPAAGGAAVLLLLLSRRSTSNTGT